MRYRVREAVQRVTVSVGPGVTALVGPNGAGKSSLFRVVAGLQRPTVGTVRLGDLDPDQPDPWQRRVGYLPQEPDLAGGVSVADTVALAGWLKGLSRRGLGTSVTDALALVDLGDRAGDRVRTLSGGMRRRLGFATAVVHRPELLVFDEPTAGLDPEQRSSLSTVINALAPGRIVLYSTHVLDDLRQVGGRVAVISAGRITFHGTVGELVDAASQRLGRELASTRAGDLDLAYLSFQDAEPDAISR